MKRSIVCLLLALCMCLSLVACGQSASESTEAAATATAEPTSEAEETAAAEPAAAEETPALSGKVTVYMPSPAGLADKLAEAFTAKTGVEVEQFQGTTGEILARLEAEQANPVADVVILASWSDGLSMKADGQLESYTPPMPIRLTQAGLTMTTLCSVTVLPLWASSTIPPLFPN